MRWWILLLLTGAAVCKGATPVQYIVRFPAPVLHYAEVEASIPVENKTAPLDLFLPVWTPGSYLVREFSRNLEDVRAFDGSGKPLEVEKTRKNRWRVASAGAGQITLKYRVYCREMTVRTNWVDENFALLNGAATFVTVSGDLQREHDVQIVLPVAWKRSLSGMTELAPNHFRAADYDTLVDSPILAGNPVVHQFQVAGKQHYLVNEGETPLWDGNRAARDTQKIVEQNLKIWGSLPYDKYLFLNLIVDVGGGLEHKNSQTIMSSRYATRTRRAYQGWLGLVSHEYFHAWNVKRLRPVELGPFDYENEVYTHNLWLAEGFTDYYGGLNVRRAQLATDADYLGVGPPLEISRSSLSVMIDAIQNTPGRLALPLAMASFDSWIRTYRPDENTRNTTVDYYAKGALTGWLLDAHIRRLTQNQKSLDDLMREAYARYSGARGYTTAQIVDLASSIAGEDLKPWFHKYLDTSEEFDFSEALQWYGLEFRAAEPPKTDQRTKAWTGAETGLNGGRFVIQRIPRDTPAERAGLSVDDEILAVDDWRVTSEGWAQRLEQYAPGDTIYFLVSRRDHIVTIPVVLGEEPARKWQLQVSSKATVEQKANFARLTGPAPVSPK